LPPSHRIAAWDWEPSRPGGAECTTASRSTERPDMPSWQIIIADESKWSKAILP
jgi:hypothetical protein